MTRSDGIEATGYVSASSRPPIIHTAPNGPRGTPQVPVWLRDLGDEGKEHTLIVGENGRMHNTCLLLQQNVRTRGWGGLFLEDTYTVIIEA